MIEQQTRQIDQPQPGYFRMRLVRKGPWVPARIRMSAFTGLVAEIMGAPADVDDVWTSGQFISQDDYEWMMDHLPTSPFTAIHASTSGMSDDMRSESERLSLYRRPIR